jgi:hypothetical protein
MPSNASYDSQLHHFHVWYGDGSGSASHPITSWNMTKGSDIVAVVLYDTAGYKYILSNHDYYSVWIEEDRWHYACFGPKTVYNKSTWVTKMHKGGGMEIRRFYYDDATEDELRLLHGHRKFGSYVPDDKYASIINQMAYKCREPRQILSPLKPDETVVVVPIVYLIRD